MRWCRCYEGQRTESWGCQDPSHTGLIIRHTTSQVSIHRFHRRSCKFWGRSVENEEPEYTWEWGVWGWGGCGCICHSTTVRCTVVMVEQEQTQVWGKLCLLRIEKTKTKDKTYTWVSVWWKTQKTKVEESTRLPWTRLYHSYCHVYLETSVS